MLRFLTAGESHGPQLTAILEGMPAGVPVSTQKIQSDMQRRKIGSGSSHRQKMEDDTVEILSGVREGKTMGSPITLVIKNRDTKNWEHIFSDKTSSKKSSRSSHVTQAEVKKAEVTAPRPGHADMAGALKYGFTDARNILERASARETAARVAVGALCRQFLEQFGIEVTSRVVQIGNIQNSNQSVTTSVRTHTFTQQTDALIAKARAAGDTLGGAVEVWAGNVPPGLGSHAHWDRKLDSQIAQALMSIPSVKAVEIGDGVENAAKIGSQVHDEIILARTAATSATHKKTSNAFIRKSNRAGGIEGGISNGEPLVARLYLKPLSTLMKPLQTVDIKTKKSVSAATERSDVCVVPRAAVIAESMLAFILAKNFLQKFGGDSLEDIKHSYRQYQKRL